MSFFNSGHGPSGSSETPFPRSAKAGLPKPGPRPSRGWLALAVLGLSWSAVAYVLPAGSIFRRMAETRDDQQLTSLRVDGSVLFGPETSRQVTSALRLSEASGSSAGMQVDAQIWLRVPGRCRIDLVPVEGDRAASVLTSTKKRAEGPEVPGLAVLLEHLCPLLASRPSGDARALIEKYVAGLKLTERTTSLARFGGQVAYVIGQPGDGHPQLWVYKDSFQPARVRIPDGAGSEWDVRFVDYSSPASGQLFPRVVEVRRGAETLLKFTAQKADSRARVDEKLF